MMSVQQPDDFGTDADEEVMDLPRFVAGLAGETKADHENHGRARVALIKRLLADPDVIDLFAQWTEGTRLGRASIQAALCWERFDRTAMLMGFGSWTEAEAHIGPDGMITANVESKEGPAIQHELDKTIDEANLAAEELEAALTASQEEFDRLFEEAKAFVRRWPRSWPWMVYELVSQWTYGLIEAASRTRQVHRYWIASPEEMPAATFESRPGETLAAAVARLIRETQGERPTLPSGRRTAPALIDRYVEWWYRHHIRGESINRIAGDVATERGLEGDARKQVRYGIDRAQRWLNVANWVWRDEDAA